MRRPIGQVRLSVPALGALAGPHWPLTLDVTLGGFPGPCDTVSVVRVQVRTLLL